MLPIILIIALCLALFVCNAVFAIVKYRKIKHDQEQLESKKLYPSKISRIGLGLRQVYFVFGLFSVVGSMAFLFSNSDSSTALQFCLYIALPINVLSSALAFLAQSRWNRYWVFDAKHFYKNKTPLSYNYEDIQFILYPTTENEMMEICTSGKRFYIYVPSLYISKIRSRIPGHVNEVSKKVVAAATGKSRKLIPLKIVGILILAVGFSGFLAGIALDENRAREFPPESQQDVPLPIDGDSSITEYAGSLYVYVDNQGGVNVYDLDGRFQYALLMDYSPNGEGGMFFYKDHLALESRGHHLYVIQNGALIGDDSIYDKLTDETLTKSRAISAGKYGLGTFGTLQIDGKTVCTTNLVQWLLNSPFVCWAIALLGMVLFAADIVLLRLRLSRKIKARTYKEAQ